MPRNPKTEALKRGAEVQANYERADEKLGKMRAARRAAILHCVSVGCTKAETSRVFKVSRQMVDKVIAGNREA